MAIPLRTTASRANVHPLQKNPRVRKIRVRNSGAGNGCANFMDTWKNAFFLQENHLRKIFPFRLFFWGGGGGADFIFMGARIFLTSGANCCENASR